MTKKKIYTGDILQNPDNSISGENEEIEMNDEMELLQFIDIWLELFKKKSVKIASTIITNPIMES